MRRWGLVVAMVALLGGVAGCGSSGESSEKSPIPSSVQLRLSIGAQERLRTELHDRAIEVHDISCGSATANVTPCVLQVSGAKKRQGTFSFVIQIDKKRRGIHIQWTGTSNRYWRELVERQARARRAAQGRRP